MDSLKKFASLLRNEVWDTYTILLCLFQIANVDGSGRLLIGFLQFNNRNNLRFDGNCCDSLPNDSSGSCTDNCDLLFNVSVFGFKK